MMGRRQTPPHHYFFAELAFIVVLTATLIWDFFNYN